MPITFHHKLQNHRYQLDNNDTDNVISFSNTIITSNASGISNISSTSSNNIIIPSLDLPSTIGINLGNNMLTLPSVHSSGLNITKVLSLMLVALGKS